MDPDQDSTPAAAYQLYEFGTKTSYPIPNPLQQLLPDSPSKSPNSRPRLIHVSFIARHGTRNPTNSSVERMTALEDWLLSSIPHRPQWLLDYSKVLTEYRRNPGTLTSHGHRDLNLIGERFASLYAKNLQRVGATVRIRASYKERAVSSAEAFRAGYIAACDRFQIMHHVTSLHSQPNSESSTVRCPSAPGPSLEGLNSYSIPASLASSLSSQSESEISTQSASSDSEFSEPDTPPEHQASSSDHLAVQVLPLGRDAILRYFEQNVEYANFTNQHKALTRKDLSRGNLRRHTADMALRMTEAFGSTTAMDIDLVRSVAEAAAFDTAHGRASTSIFCNTITPVDVRVLDTFERRHRPFFKAHERFENVSAPLVKDLAESLTASVENSKLSSQRRRTSAYSADTRFAHAETLIPLLLLLGIRSNGLHPSNPEYRQGLAVMSPFAANLALELYEDEEKDGSKFHFVRFRLNERYVERVPALGEYGRNGVVRLNHLLEFFDNVLADEN